MPLTPEAVQTYFTDRLREFHFGHYLRSRGYTELGAALEPGESTGEIAHPEEYELSPSATRAEPDTQPESIRESYAFFHKGYDEVDIGSTKIFTLPIDGEVVSVVRVTTDGDDGYLEIYSEQGDFLGAARTNLDTVLFGTREWLRDQVANYGEFPPEMFEAMKKSFYGKPLPWDCQAPCWQCQATGGTGCCMCKKGHRETTYDLHRCNSGHNWDDTPPDARLFVKPKFELKTVDGGVLVGSLTDYKITLHTRHGDITVYAADLEKIDFAPTNPFDTTRQIALAIHKLGGAEGDAAESELIGIGVRAYPALMAAGGSGSGPINKRAKAIAESIQLTEPAEALNRRTEHWLTAHDIEFAGTFDSDRFHFDFVTDKGFARLDLHSLRQLKQLPGPMVEVPHADPRWLGRFYTNWYGAELTFIVKGNTNDGTVYGTDVYALDSMLATSAVHAGRVKDGETKVVRVEIILAPEQYTGSERNGVTSIDWDMPTTGAYRFID